MIKEILSSDYDSVLEFIKNDNARNYFIRLSFESKKNIYDSILGEYNENEKLKAVLLIRKSGNLQFYANSKFDVDGFVDYISKIEFNSLISPSSYCDKFLDEGLFSRVKDGAIIAKLDVNNKIVLNKSLDTVQELKVSDLENVVNLYKKVFSGFTSKEVMKEKLRSGRGRGVCIKNNDEIISIAQSEFESENSAIIVGVATDPSIQGRGLGTMCLLKLCKELQDEGKNLYLQYDNLDAGKIYERIGFKPIDRVKHYMKY